MPYKDREEGARKAKGRREHKKKFINRVKIFFGCEFCGFKKHPAALSFDHRIQSEKYRTKHQSTINKTWGMPKIKEEIRKCRILCLNCHSIKTIEEENHLWRK